MNSSRKGNGRELRSAAILENQGYVVGSRRHTAGPGDLMAVKPGARSRLIEVKATAGGPYEHFRRADRKALRDYAHAHGMAPELAYWAPRARTHRIIPAEEWPA